MTFQRRHYIAIAKLLATLRADALDRGDMFLLESVDQFAARLIETFRADNRSFDPAHFLSAVTGV